MKYYRVMLRGRQGWQEWHVPDDATYSSHRGWDYLYWFEDGKRNRVWIRHENAQAIQMTENEEAAS